MADPELIPSLPLDLALDCLLRVPLQSLSTLQQVCRSWRALICSPAFYQARHNKGFKDHQACIIQSTQAPPSPGKSPAYQISAFDERHQTWSPLAPIPDLPHGLPLFCSCVSIGACLVLLGGWDPTSWSVLTSVYIFDFRTSRWRSGARMPTPRSFFACAACDDGKIVVAGGHDHSKNALRSAEMYDIGRDAWESLPDMAQERDECKAACVDGSLMVVSGFSTESQGQFLASAERFDFGQRKWETVDNIWAAGRPPSSIVPFKGQLYALLDGHLMRYKSHDSAWEAVVALPTAVKVPACATPLSDGILVVGFSGVAEQLSVVRFCVGNGASPPAWKAVTGNACFGSVQQTACTVQM